MPKSCFDGYLTSECITCEWWRNGEENMIGCACPFPISHCDAFSKMEAEEEKNS